MKRFIRSFVALLVSVTVLLFGLLFWLLNPLDHQSWRVKLHVSLLDVMPIRAYPLLQIASSYPGRILLNDYHWQSSHGVVWVQNEASAVRVNCEPCTFQIPELSKYPVRIDRLSLIVRHINQQLSGLVELQSESYTSRIFYTGHISEYGVNLNWSLPKTPLKTLLQPLQDHSLVLQKASIRGTLVATGMLQWPSRKWSANPELQGLEVTGLATEKLKVAELNYHCPTALTKQSRDPSSWVTEKNMGRWLPKAVLIAEDAVFTQHPGYNMDVIRFLLAQGNRDKHLGGSTITQQLAKYLFTGGERSWIRKAEELLYAVEMERTLGKRLILALYLNTVDWGSGICGAGQAASVYFGRKPAQLSPIQAAWMAGIIRNPHLAWQQEYLPKTPDVERLRWVIRFMPRRVRLLPLSLKFAEQPGK